MDEARVEQIADAKINLAMNRVAFLNNVTVRLGLMKQNTMNAISSGATIVSESASSAWTGIKKFFSKSTVVGHTAIPENMSDTVSDSVVPNEEACTKDLSHVAVISDNVGVELSSVETGVVKNPSNTSEHGAADVFDFSSR
jgi:hypothetical protein